MVCTTWPVLTNIATSSALTIACVKRRIVTSGHLKTIWPLRSSGTAINSRENSAIAETIPLKDQVKAPSSESWSELLCFRAVEAIQCGWCQAQNQPGTTTCMTCGAPLDVRDKVSDSGWREAPRLRDMTEFQFLGKHLPGGRRTGPRRGDRPLPAGRRLLRAPHPAVEGRVGPALLHADERPAADHPRRHAAHRDGRQRPRPDRVLPGRAGRARGPAAAPRHGA